MRRSHLSRWLRRGTARLCRDFGRYLLFMCLAFAAVLGSLLGGVLLFGLVHFPEASAPAAIRMGGPVATAALESFTPRQSQVFTMVWGVALFTGVAALWIYQQTLAKLGDVEVWLRTWQYREGVCTGSGGSVARRTTGSGSARR